MSKNAGFRLFCLKVFCCFFLDAHQFCYMWSLELLPEMCTIWTSKAQFWGHFGPQCNSKFWTLVTFSKCFHWFHISIASHTHCKYFQQCVEYGPQMPNFEAILGPKVNQNSGIWSFCRRVFTGFTSVLLHMLIACTFRCVENMTHRCPILGPLKICKNSDPWSFSQKVCTGFASVFCISLHVNLGYF